VKGQEPRAASGDPPCRSPMLSGGGIYLAAKRLNFSDGGERSLQKKVRLAFARVPESTCWELSHGRFGEDSGREERKI